MQKSFSGNRAIHRLHKRIGTSVPLDREDVLQFCSAIESLRGRRTLVLAGGVADADSVGSAFALSELLGPPAAFAVTTPADAVRKLLGKLGIENVPMFRDVDPSDWDALLVTDTSSSHLVKGIEGWDGKLEGVVDHHMPSGVGDLQGRSFTFVDTNIPSTCSMLAASIPDKRLSRRMALALASGLVVDSANITRGGASSHLLFAYLSARSGLQTGEITQMSFGEMDLAVRCNILASLGATSYIVKDHVLAGFSISPKVAARRELVAMLADLLTGGPARVLPAADVALCTLQFCEQEVVLYSLRASPGASPLIDLNKIARKISEVFGGSGGGRKKEAGGDVPASTDSQSLTEAFRIAVAEQLAA